MQQDVSRAVSSSLASQTRTAQEQQAKAQEVMADLQGQLAACREQCPEGDVGIELEQQMHRDQASDAADVERLATCQARQQQARQAAQSRLPPLRPDFQEPRRKRSIL